MITTKSTIDSVIHPTESASTNDSQSRIVQNFVLIWLESNINELAEDYQHSIAQLRSIVTTINIFSDADECVDFLTEIKDEKVFMIISSVLGEQLVPILHEILQLYSIYVFCVDRYKHDAWAIEWAKVKGVFTQIEPICNILKLNTKQCDHDLIPISIISPNDYSNRDLNELEPSFMYSQVLKEILLDMEHNKHAKEELIQLWRENYRNDKCSLKIIDEFERDYEHSSAIWWYTRDTFIYSMLNRALRTMDVDIVIKMGFFLRDVHREIERLHAEQSDIRTELTVYRGQGMLNSEFEKLCNSKGGLLSFNNFLSTSGDLEVAKVFCPIPQLDPDIVATLFEIKVDSTLVSTPFAFLDNVSNFSDQEKEILFSMHAVFRIEELTKIEEGVWHVQLTLTNDNDEQLKVLTDLMRDNTSGSTGWHRLGLLMIRMQEFNKAEDVYRTLLNSASTDDEIELALLNQDHSNALLFYEKALKIIEKILPSNHPDLVIIYNNIGRAYQQMKDSSSAMSFYQKALAICEKVSYPDHFTLAIIYNNIGLIYGNMKDYSNALLFYKKTLEIQQKSLPLNHPCVALTYSNIGRTHENMDEHSIALSLYKRALEIQEIALPPNHSDLATIYSNIGSVHNKMNDYSSTLLFYQKALEIREKSFPPNYRTLMETYNNIGKVYYNEGDYSNALVFCQKALEIREKNFSSNNFDLAQAYNNTAGVYDKIGDYSHAIYFYHKTREIYENSISLDHYNLMTTYNKIGLAYNNIGSYSSALSFFQKAIEIFEKFLPREHLKLAQIYNNIGVVYMNMDDYLNALSFYQKALDIRQEYLCNDHFDLAESYNNIGMIFKELKNYSSAYLSFEKALAVMEKSLPPNHPKLVIIYGNIGSLLDNMGDYSTALSYLLKASEIVEKTLPPNDPCLQKICKTIGSVYYNMGEYSRALSFYQRALEIGQKSLPSNHPELVTNYSSIGALHEKMGQYPAALSFFKLALDIGRRSLPDNHSHLLDLERKITDIHKNL